MFSPCVEKIYKLCLQFETESRLRLGFSFWFALCEHITGHFYIVRSSHFNLVRSKAESLAAIFLPHRQTVGIGIANTSKIADISIQKF